MTEKGVLEHKGKIHGKPVLIMCSHVVALALPTAALAERLLLIKVYTLGGYLYS